jgi:uncharacterized protein
MLLLFNQFTDSPAPTAPATPTGLAATVVSPTRVDLTWNDVSGNETGFKIERKTGSAGGYVEISRPDANVETFSDVGLTPGTAYFYRIRSYNDVGNSAYSDEATATTSTPPPSTSPPNAPTNLEVLSATTSQIAVSWIDHANDESGFRIERKTGSEAFLEIATVGPDVSSYVNAGLAENTTYVYRVRAYNGFGDSDYTNEASATTGVTPPPPPPPGTLGVWRKKYVRRS